MDIILSGLNVYLKLKSFFMQGHVVLLLKSGGGALFSGDHLGGTKSDVEKPDLCLSRIYNQYSGTSFTSHRT